MFLCGHRVGASPTLNSLPRRAKLPPPVHLPVFWVCPLVSSLELWWFSRWSEKRSTKSKMFLTVPWMVRESREGQNYLPLLGTAQDSQPSRPTRVQLVMTGQPHCPPPTPTYTHAPHSLLHP